MESNIFSLEKYRKSHGIKTSWKRYRFKKFSIIQSFRSFEQFLKKLERLDYKRLKYIIDHTRDSPLVKAQRIYDQAIRIYKKRGYRLYTNENKTNEVKAFLSESLDLELEEGLSKVDDGSPEGLRMDEIDWESYDHE